MDYTAGKLIGPAFADEIASLADRRFSWGPDGRFTIDDRMAPVDMVALRAALDAVSGDAILPAKLRALAGALKKVIT